MKQYLYLIISLVLFIACEDEQEKDCRGSEGGTVILDSCGVYDPYRFWIAGELRISGLDL